MRWKQTVTVVLCLHLNMCVYACMHRHTIRVCICSAFLSSINGSHLESVSQCVYCFHRWSSDTVWITEINDSHCSAADGKNNSHTPAHTHILCLCIPMFHGHKWTPMWNMNKVMNWSFCAPISSHLAQTLDQQSTHWIILCRVRNEALYQLIYFCP